MTYSVVIRDPVTGSLGVAVESRLFAAGTLVPWAEAGVGAVATQAFPDLRYGRCGIEAMRADSSATDVLNALLAEDDAPEVRQVAMVDARGGVAVHTGTQCVPAAGSRTGDGWSVQGNLLTTERVLDAMDETLADTRSDPGVPTDVPQRLMAALRAGEDAGGDVRGSQAAAMLVVSGKRGTQPWNEVLVDLRVDDSADPIAELGRLLIRQAAAAELTAALMHPGLVAGSYDAGAAASVDAVLAALQHAEAGFTSDDPQVPLWLAVLLARCGRVDEARAALRVAITRQPRLHDIAQRLAQVGIISASVAKSLSAGA